MQCVIVLSVVILSCMFVAWIFNKVLVSVAVSVSPLRVPRFFPPSWASLKRCLRENLACRGLAVARALCHNAIAGVLCTCCEQASKLGRLLFGRDFSRRRGNHEKYRTTESVRELLTRDNVTSRWPAARCARSTTRSRITTANRNLDAGRRDETAWVGRVNGEHTCV